MESKSYGIAHFVCAMDEIRSQREVTTEHASEKILQWSSQPPIYYMAVEIKNENFYRIQGEVYVATYDKEDKTFSYNHYTEDENPKHYGCPKSILKLLSPTQNEKAQLWRSGCLEFHKTESERRKKNISLKEMPLHSKIKIEENGKEVILEKNYFMAFRRPVWVEWKTWKEYTDAKISRIGYVVLELGK